MEGAEERDAFLASDADRLLDEAYAEIKAKCAEDPNYQIKPPQLFSNVHEHSAERPIIGGTPLYKQLWDAVVAANDEEEREGEQ